MRRIARLFTAVKEKMLCCDANLSRQIEKRGYGSEWETINLNQGLYVLSSSGAWHLLWHQVNLTG